MRAVVRRFLRQAEILTAMGLVFVASWAFVAWMTLDMSHPLVQLTMPLDAAWSRATAVAVAVMWAGMMFAMMLPSAAPMILTFDSLERRNVEPGQRPGGRRRGLWSSPAAIFSSGWGIPGSPPARNGDCRRAPC